MPKPANESPGDLLRQVSIFQGLDSATLDQLGACLKPLHFDKDALIVGQDDPGHSLFILVRGRVKVVLFSDSGREMILTLFRPGDFFGEMSLLDGQPRSASVIAVEPSQVQTLSREDFVHHLEQSPPTALKILAEMSMRLRRADEIIGNLALLDVHARVARTLADLAATEGIEQPDGILIPSRPTQQDLAAMIGTSRETVSRVLSEFQRRGLVTSQGKSVLLSHGFQEAVQANA